MCSCAVQLFWRWLELLPTSPVFWYYSRVTLIREDCSILTRRKKELRISRLGNIRWIIKWSEYAFACKLELEYGFLSARSKLYISRLYTLKTYTTSFMLECFLLYMLYLFCLNVRTDNIYHQFQLCFMHWTIPMPLQVLKLNSRYLP